jgi:hypothetical protein
MANSTILALVQSFCREYAQPVPTALQGVTDAGALQMRELVLTVGEDVWGATNWQQCSRTATWTSVAGASQGSILTLCPESMSHIIPQTFWDLTARLPVEGPVGNYKRMQTTAYGLATPLYYFYIENNLLKMQSSMPVNHSMSLIYKSYNWILPHGSGTATKTFANDDDVCVFSDIVMKAGLRAFWLRMKQMPHKFEMEHFEDLKLASAGANTVQPILSVDNEGTMPYAGIVIPLGNWTP